MAVDILPTPSGVYNSKLIETGDGIHTDPSGLVNVNLQPILPDPVISPDGGIYDSTQSVTISSVEGAEIFYTTDGSTPSRSSTLYTTAISVSTDTTVKAIAYHEDYGDSNVVTEEYTIVVFSEPFDDLDDWTEVGSSPNPGGIVDGTFRWHGIEPPSETASWISNFAMDKDDTWQVELTVDWYTFTVNNYTAPGPSFKFGFGPPGNNTFHRYIAVQLDALNLPVYYYQYPGLNKGILDNQAPPMKWRFRFYGSGHADYGKSTVWIYSYERGAWGWRTDIPDVWYPAGLTSSYDVQTEIDQYFKAEWTTVTSGDITVSELDGIIDSFIVTEGTVL